MARQPANPLRSTKQSNQRLVKANQKLDSKSGVALTDSEILELELLLQEEMYVNSEKRLFEFYKNFWNCHDPSNLHASWVQECVAEHIEAALRRDIRRLTVSIPPRCLPEDTSVLMNDGSYKALRDIQVGDYVKSSDFSVIRDNRVLRVIDSGKKECIRLTFDNGTELVTSRKHKIYTSKGYVKCEDLQEGHHVYSNFYGTDKSGCDSSKRVGSDIPFEEIEEYIEIPEWIQERNKVSTSINALNKLFSKKDLEKLAPVKEKYANGTRWRRIVKKEDVGIIKCMDITVENDHNFYANNVLVSNSGKTVAKGTKLIMHDGVPKCIEDIKVGDSVLSFNIETNTHEIKTVSNFWDEGNKEFYAVTLCSGKKIICTEDHRVYTWKGYRHLRDMKIGDDISIGYGYSDHIERTKITTDSEEYLSKYSDAALRLLALWQAEGHKNYGTYRISNFSSEIIEQLKLDGNTLGYKYVKQSEGLHSLTGKSVVTGEYARNWINTLYNGYRCTTYTLTIPSYIFSLPLDKLTTYLGMWIATDGWIDSAGIGICLASEVAINQLETLFTSIGFRCKTRKRVIQEKFVAWELYINGLDNVLLAKELFVGKLFQDNIKLQNLSIKACSRVRSIPPESIEDATSAHKWVLTKARSRWAWKSKDSINTSDTVIYSDVVKDRINKEEYWDRIASIEYIGSFRGYDIEVAGNNNFVLDNGIHSHNSTISISAICHHWIKSPWEKFWLVSHSSKLFIQNIVLTRRIMEHPLYRDRWMNPDLPEHYKFILSKDVNTKTRVENDNGGYILGGSPSSGALGMGYSVAFLDDPLDSEEANSPEAVAKVNNWYTQTFLNRSNDVNTDVQIIVMQRLRSNDIIDYVNKTYGDQEWFNLVLPAKYDPKRIWFSPIGFNDPRKYKNELLDPVRLPDSFLAAQAKNQIIYNTRYQQDPESSGDGNMVQKEWIVEIDKLPTVFDQMITVWDLSFGDSPKSSYSVGVVLGSREGKYYCIDMIRDRMEVPEQVDAIRTLKDKYPKAQIGVEKRANGNAAISLLRREIHDIYAFQPRLFGGSKEQRLSATLPYFRDKLVHVYSPFTVDVSRHLTYDADIIIKELVAFPLGDDDDIVDCFGYGLQWLAEFGKENMAIITGGHDLILPDEMGGSEIYLKGSEYRGDEILNEFNYDMFGGNSSRSSVMDLQF